MLPDLARFDSRPIAIASLRLTFGVVVGSVLFSALATGVFRGERVDDRASSASGPAGDPAIEEHGAEAEGESERPGSEALIVIVDDGGDLPGPCN